MGGPSRKNKKFLWSVNYNQRLVLPILETRQGGKAGGFSWLTDAAKTMMHQYSAFQEEVEAAAQKIFQKYFPGA